MIHDDELIVANAGDSRCLLCRDGVALPMSFDHKPTNSQEKERILAAGGKIIDGRINQGLNLSRAIGTIFIAFKYSNYLNLIQASEMHFHKILY